MKELARSRVNFISVQHTYMLGEKFLQGVTSLIQRKCFPGEYDNVPEKVLANAAERGHRVHTAVELYDDYGTVTEDCTELEAYMAEQAKGTHKWLQYPIESEYIVSDNQKYASAIDKVYATKGGVILADIKTTYKLNKEYVSWQLSIYRYFFNLLNPDVEVKGLYAIWLRDGKCVIEEVDEHEGQEVKDLLYTDWCPTKNADFDEDELIELKRTLDEAQAAYDEAKERMLEMLKRCKAKKMKGTYVTLTLKDDCERNQFDAKAFKADNPELYEKYLKKTMSKGGLMIKFNN